MADELPKPPGDPTVVPAVAPVLGTAAPTTPAPPVPRDARDVRADAVLSERPREASKKLFVGFRVAVPVANGLGGAAETLARRGRDGNLAHLLR